MVCMKVYFDQLYIQMHGEVLANGVLYLFDCI